MQLMYHYDFACNDYFAVQFYTNRKGFAAKMNGISSSQRVNYDLIAHLYDEPGRDYEPDENLIDFLNQRTDRHYSAVRILDMGCGTGKQLTANHNHFPDVQMIGLDLFHGMLEQARRRSRDIQWIQGDNTAPPLANNSFDYITNQFSYHHVQDKNRMITSIFQILKPNGRTVITNLDPWSMPGWILYTFFPGARHRDLLDFLPVNVIAALMEKAGFCKIRVKYQYRHSEENLNDFLKYASQRHRTSQLIAIKDHEYAAGTATLKACIAKLGIDSCVSSEICLVWITGDKPG